MAHRGNHTVRLSLLVLAILAGLALQKVDAHKQVACDHCAELPVKS